MVPQSIALRNKKTTMMLNLRSKIKKTESINRNKQINVINNHSISINPVKVSLRILKEIEIS